MKRMATGINDQMINSLKVDLLSCIESINSMKNKLECSRTNIEACYSGTGASTLLGKLDSIMNQFPKISANINTYIDDLSSVVKSYTEQDEDLASTVIQDISKLDI